jgi:hypothetical protein
MLTAPHISELDLEPAALALMQEFLAKWFDGGTHAVGGNAAVPFPQCELRFQQSALDQPMSLPCIALVWSDPASVERRWETVNGARQQMAYARVRWTFFVRASGTNSRKVAGDAASRLAGLLANAAATRPLAQKGIHRLRPGLPQAVNNSNYALRVLQCVVALRYPILSQVS